MSYDMPIKIMKVRYLLIGVAFLVVFCLGSVYLFSMSHGNAFKIERMDDKGFSFEKEFNPGDHHYGLIFKKQ